MLFFFFCKRKLNTESLREFFVPINMNVSYNAFYKGTFSLKK